ncbi:uncharacterized protein B0H18DRAFT_1128200 [Fomitopsis serialis]|uniref:uncharacterized protein n=1 Tax=Fomitopsis serialis TaxID=139415 RepID=UPI0020089671|nr:uncharacterized protein B0H18DRAFT_1128200 [Neoantrodia serialis]KAH9911743.1 hypothetical protein B0H18DRAFT_1128200 [Neoantrodia serialis]
MRGLPHVDCSTKRSWPPNVIAATCLNQPTGANTQTLRPPLNSPHRQSARARLSRASPRASVSGEKPIQATAAQPRPTRAARHARLVELGRDLEACQGDVAQTNERLARCEARLSETVTPRGDADTEVAEACALLANARALMVEGQVLLVDMTAERDRLAQDDQPPVNLSL